MSSPNALVQGSQFQNYLPLVWTTSSCLAMFVHARTSAKLVTPLIGPLQGGTMNPLAVRWYEKVGPKHNHEEVRVVQHLQNL